MAQYAYDHDRASHPVVSCDVEVQLPALRIVGIGHDAFAESYAIRCLVEPDGDVLVWDSVAGHYSRHHRLTADQLAQARSFAAVQRRRWTEPG